MAGALARYLPLPCWQRGQGLRCSEAGEPVGIIKQHLQAGNIAKPAERVRRQALGPAISCSIRPAERSPQQRHGIRRPQLSERIDRCQPRRVCRRRRTGQPAACDGKCGWISQRGEDPQRDQGRSAGLARARAGE